MTRISILLVALLALVVTACGSSETSAAPDESQVVATPEPTEEATPEPDEPEESEAAESTPDAGNGGSATALVDLLPDTVGGASRTDIDMTSNPAFAPIFEEQGLDPEDFEFVISTYGTGDEALGVTSMRIPDMGQAELQQLARLMTAYSEGEADAETGNVGGKEVLILSATGADEQAYMYFADGAVFVVGGGSEDLVAEFLSQLP